MSTSFVFALLLVGGVALIGGMQVVVLVLFLRRPTRFEG